jgi:catechol 2,3-dioxygenase-like lactoylglutathione lyase family enzyme
MSTNEVRSDDAARNAGVARIDMKLEVIVIPVSDVDRAKEFYGRIRWRFNFDRSAGEDFRLVQFTPPGSWCSVQFGKNVTSAGEKRIGQRDANWPDWYAAYMVAEQSGKTLPQ